MALATLIERLDAAVADRNDEKCCRGVKDALVGLITSGGLTLEPRFLEPTPDRYARRLLHRDPDTYRYIPETIRRYPGAGGVAGVTIAARSNTARSETLAQADSTRAPALDAAPGNQVPSGPRWL